MKTPNNYDSNVTPCNVDFNRMERLVLQKEIEKLVMSVLDYAYLVQVVTSNVDPDIFVVRVFNVSDEEEETLFKKIMDLSLAMFPDEEVCLLPSLKSPEVTEKFYAIYERKKNPLRFECKKGDLYEVLHHGSRNRGGEKICQTHGTQN